MPEHFREVVQLVECWHSAMVITLSAVVWERENHQLLIRFSWQVYASSCDINCKLRKGRNRSIFYIFGQIRSKLEYCCHIWVRATQSNSSLDKVQSGLVGDDIFSPCSLFLRDNITTVSLFPFFGYTSSDLYI